MYNEATPKRIGERAKYEKRVEKTWRTKAEYGIDARYQDLEKEIKEAEPAAADEARKVKNKAAAASTKEVSEGRNKDAAASKRQTDSSSSKYGKSKWRQR